MGGLVLVGLGIGRSTLGCGGVREAVDLAHRGSESEASVGLLCRVSTSIGIWQSSRNHRGVPGLCRSTLTGGRASRSALTAMGERSAFLHLPVLPLPDL